MRQKQILLACAVLIACVLGGCGGGEKAATGLPESYTLGDETVAALPAPEGAEVTDDTPTIYTYTGLESPGTVVQAYVLQLTNEQNGFSVVDDQFVRTDAPDLNAESGTVLLAKDSAAENQVLLVRVDWSAGQCVVTADTAEGVVAEPEPVPEIESITVTQAENIFLSLSPQFLGLEGDSMDRYNVYVMSGEVMVDGIPCRRFKVYDDQNPEQTNAIAGIYCLSSDGLRLYRYDEASDTVTELPLVGVVENSQ